MILFYFVYLSPSTQKLFIPLVNFYAKISSAILNISGFGTVVSGDIISSSGFAIGVKKGCDALEPMALLLSGIVAFPSSWRKKMYGLAAGLFVLFVFNIIRIASLFVVGIKNPSLFEAMHLEVWQMVFILISIVIWIIWVRKAVKK